MIDKIVGKYDRKLFYYIVLLLVVVLLCSMGYTYAYFTVTTKNSTTPIEGASKIGCLNIERDDNSTIYNLEYNYPIEDEYAISSIKPVNIKIHNKCDETKEYKLVITVYNDNTNKYIDASKIRYKYNNKDIDYLDNLYLLETKEDMIEYKDIYNNLDKKVYIISDEMIYKDEQKDINLYLWIDYYEGDKTHDKKDEYNNSTEGKTFLSQINITE